MRRLWIAIGLLAVLTPALAQAQDPAPGVLDDITVTGSDARGIPDFIDGLTTPGRHGSVEGQIARWEDPVCVRVIGGWHAVNVALAGRIGETIRSLNIRTGDEGCRPNAMVVIAEDPEGFARVFAERFRNGFFSNSRAQMNAFIGPPRAVRWRHRIVTGGAASAPLIDSRIADMGGDAVALPNTRLRRSTAENITRAIVVVDPARIEGVPTDAVVGYLTLALLVDLGPSPDAGGHPSVLGLFDERADAAPPIGLTAWDRAFVEGVYAMSPVQRFSVQKLEIERRMRRSLTGTVEASSAGDAD